MTDKEKKTETVEEKIKDKKPLTKRDVAKFIGGKLAGAGGYVITKSIVLPKGLKYAQDCTHPAIATLSVVAGAASLSFGVAKYAQENGEQLVDDICDCIVMIDDFRKEVAKDREKAKEEAMRMTAEHTA